MTGDWGPPAGVGSVCRTREEEEAAAARCGYDLRTSLPVRGCPRTGRRSGRVFEVKGIGQRCRIKAPLLYEPTSTKLVQHLPFHPSAAVSSPKRKLHQRSFLPFGAISKLQFTQWAQSATCPV
ncbi:unnamed protein product [Lampetra planeri]